MTDKNRSTAAGGILEGSQLTTKGRLSGETNESDAVCVVFGVCVLMIRRITVS